MSQNTIYKQNFYSDRSAGSLSSARVVLDIVLKHLHPKSIIDFGCAQGEWLSVAKESGVETVHGLDGDWVDTDSLLIPQQSFQKADLNDAPNWCRDFDLAISLEVAEHLRPETAASFIKAITSAAPFVLFSAAVPHQGGTGHLNEQWPEYWIDLFKQSGFNLLDCIRPILWLDSNVSSTYAQNILLFHDRTVEVPASLRKSDKAVAPDFGGAPIIHPRSWVHSAVFRGDVANIPWTTIIDGIARKARRNVVQYLFRRRP